MDESKQDLLLELVAKSLKGELASDDKKLLEKLTSESAENQNIIQDSKKIWELSDLKNDIFQPDAEKAWAKVLPQLSGISNDSNLTIEQEADYKVITISFWQGLGRLAASILIILGIVFLFWKLKSPIEDTLITVNTDHFHKKTIMLPDSSQIFLNKNSSITYSSNFLKSREVFLEGEGYFEVRKKNGAPFEVTTNSSVTTVLGTSFLIKTKNETGNESIVVFSGKVSFAKSVSNTAPVLLSKGMRANINYENIRVVKEDLKNQLSWKNEKLQFENESLESVLKSMELYFNIHFEIKTVI